MNIARLSEYEAVSTDCETTGLHWYKDSAFGIAIAGLRADGTITARYFDTRTTPQVVDVLKAELPKVRLLVNHNIKFDAHFLMNLGIRVPLDRIECTSVRAALINEHEPSFSLDALCKKYIDEGKVDIWDQLAALFGGAPTKAVQIKNLHRAPTDLAAKYAVADPALALKLWLWQEKEIERQGLQRIWHLERKVTPILVQIERQGIRVDSARAKKSMAAIDVRVAEAQRELNRLAGFEVNPNSASQIRRLFGTVKTVREDGVVEWRSSKGFLLAQTDSGEASFDKATLMVMAAEDPRAANILTMRRLLKGKSFLKDHILGHAVNGRVYPNYNQTRGESGLGTGTGRFSIDDPALQQIPMHDIDVAEVVRPCFLPEEKQQWGCADWNQFEFRWFAHYVKDPNINELYRKNANADFHSTVAGITGITRDRKFAGDTANAKQINLGLVFGMGEGEMAYNMGMDYTVRTDSQGRVWKTAGPKAKEIFAKYHDAIPGVKDLLQQASSIARARGYVQTIMGRRIRFPQGKFVHKAGGLVFQGTSADCMKLKMVELFPLCKKEGWRYLLTVHDEHDISVPTSKTDKAEPVIKKILETFDGKECEVECRIPIRTSIAFGKNWWEACK